MNTVRLHYINSDSFHGAFHLRRFTAMWNYLTTLQDGILKGLENMYELDLGFNDISVIDLHAFEGLDNLEILDFNENSLTTETLNGRFVHTPRVRSLYLGANRLTHLPARFFNSPEMRVLFVYNNNITSIDPDAFLGMPLLESLLLYLNNVGSLHGSFFREMTNLDMLDVTLIIRDLF